MDETMIGWIFLLAMLLWRGITTLRFVQRCLHCLGPIAAILQWYTLTYLGLVLLLLRTFWDIVKYDYIGYHFLADEKIQDNFDQICEGTKLDDAACSALKFEMRIPHWLRAVSLIAPVCGVVAFLWLASILSRFIMYNHHKKVQDESCEEWRLMPWKLPIRLEYVLIVIGVPLIFVVMSMRSLIRIWAVMTGSCWKPGIVWDDVVRLEMSTYTMDLELASTFQFYAIWQFGLLCTNFLKHSKYISAEDEEAGRQYRHTLAYTSIQGVYAFVVVGVLRTAFDIVVTYLGEDPRYKAMSETIQEKALGKVGTIFAFVTLLCMLNMVLVSKVRDLKDNLGNANLKFLGTRLLLLIAQIQPLVLSAVTVGSPLFLEVKKVVQKLDLHERFGLDLTRWTFTSHQALLCHVSLLNVEGLVVVMVTALFWRLDSQQRAALMFQEESSWSGRKKAQAREASGYAPLLSA